MSASSMSYAAAWRMRWTPPTSRTPPPSTSLLFRPTASCTRACSWPIRYGASIRSWPTKHWSPPSRWCTPGSAPTPWGRGVWPTPTGSCSTTARSTPCGATSTGWPPGKGCWRRRHSATTYPSCSPSYSRGRATLPVSTTPWSCYCTRGAHCLMPC